LEQKPSTTLKAPLSILHVPQEQLHFAKQKLPLDEIDTAQEVMQCSGNKVATAVALHFCFLHNLYFPTPAYNAPYVTDSINKKLQKA